MIKFIRALNIFKIENIQIKIKSIFCYLESLPLTLSILSCLIGSFPVINFLGDLIFRWREETRKVWSYFFVDIFQLNLNFNSRQYDFFTFYFIIIMPIILKVINRYFIFSFIKKTLLYLFESIGINKNILVEKKEESQENEKISYHAIIILLLMYINFNSSFEHILLTSITSIIIAILYLTLIFSEQNKGIHIAEQVPDGFGYFVILFLIIFVFAINIDEYGFLSGILPGIKANIYIFGLPAIKFFENFDFNSDPFEIGVFLAILINFLLYPLFLFLILYYCFEFKKNAKKALTLILIILVSYYLNVSITNFFN